MKQILPWNGLLLLAGAALFGGCSARSGSITVAAGHHDNGVRLTPDPANATSRIAVVFDDSRIMPASCRYQWTRNGMLIVDANSDALDPASFSKNDLIAVTVGVPDVASGTEKTLKADVHVQNSPPKLTRVSVVIAPAAGVSTLQARVESVDPDGDNLTYTYRWFKNGKLIDGASESSVQLSKVGTGDGVIVEAVAHDGVSDSAPLRSDALTVDNRPPVFTSQPGAPKPADVEFQYSAIASDPDGDALHIELVRGPDGMTVDPSGSVQWSLPTGQDHRGDFSVRLRATDSKGGEATQDFTIHLDPPPTTPTSSGASSPSSTSASSSASTSSASASPSSAPPATAPRRVIYRHSYFADTTGSH